MSTIDDFDTQIQVEEIMPTDYEEYMDTLSIPPSKSDVTFVTQCTECGEMITDFEREINEGICPGCDSPLPFNDCESCEGIDDNCPAPIEIEDDIPL